jgi:hypothetical protein
MENKVVINMKPQMASEAIKSYSYIPHEVVDTNELIVEVVAVGLILILTILSIAQMIKWEPLDTFLAFQDIQRNFNKWPSILSDYEILESNKISNLKIYMKNYNTITCVDYGTYYIPAYFQSSNGLLLPTAIRRGNGDAWMITKSDPNDQAAYQQCLYLASEMSNNTITCGSDMYNKLGYGGYLNNGHWCNSIRDKLYNIFSSN